MHPKKDTAEFYGTADDDERTMMAPGPGVEDVSLGVEGDSMGKQIRKYKKEFDYSYSLGVFPTIELLNHRRESVLRILISSKGKRNKGILEIVRICRNKNIEVETNDKLIDRLSPKGNCFSIGIFKKFRTRLKDNVDHLVLVNPSNTGNLGTIARTMSGFCVDSLALIRPSTDIFDPKTVRSSMGSIFQISSQYFDNISEYMGSFNNNLYTFMTNGKRTLDEVSFKRPCSIIFGNESSGLPDEYLELGTSVNISHGEGIDSLNLSVSVGIALYEMSRKTH